PNETVTLSFAASDAIYFDVTHFDSAFRTALEYTIENNDITTLTLHYGDDTSTEVSNAQNSVNEGDSVLENGSKVNSLNAPYYIHTSLAIAPNVPTINISFETLSDDDVALCSAAAGEEVVCANDSSDYTLTHLEFGNETGVVNGAVVPVAIAAEEERSVPFRIVGESEWVERHEKVVFRVDATVPTGYALSDYATVSSPDTVTHTIINDDQVTVSLYSKESETSVVLLDTESGKESITANDTRSSMIDHDLVLRGDKSVAKNVPELIYTFSANGDNTATISSGGVNNDFDIRRALNGTTSSVRSIILNDSDDYVKNSNIDFLLTYYDDNVVEYDEKIDYKLSLNADRTAYAQAVVDTVKLDFEIVNEDKITFVKVTDLSLTELESDPVSADNDVVFTFEFELPATSIDPNITNLTFSYNVENPDSGTTAVAADLGITAFAVNTKPVGAALGAITMTSIVDDSIIEVDESFKITSFNLYAGDVANAYDILTATPPDSSYQFEIENNDYVSIGFENTNNAFNESDDIALKIKLCTGCSISEEAKLGDFTIENNIIKVESDFEPMPSANILTDLENLITTSKLANYSSTEEAERERRVVIATAKQDAEKEENEWLNFYVTQPSLCPDNGCFGEDMSSGLSNSYYGSADLNKDGLVVIVNDDYIAATDTNVSKCLEISGSPGSYVATTSTLTASGCGPTATTSLQDVEVEVKTNAYSFVNTSGIPVRNKVDGTPPEITDYHCVQDNYTGVLWNADYKTSEVIFDTATLDPAAVGTTYCGNTNVGVSGPNWQLPTVADLINTLDFNNFQVDGENRFKNWLSYWTSEPCLADLTKYWVVDMATGKTMCKPVNESHHAYAVYY
ncbi:MAG: DUF1566 domain-containing protein, partial [Oleispira sp.]